MRIVHITFSLPNAGKENMLVDIANEQSRNQHKIAIVVINKCIDKSIKNRIDSGIQLLELNRRRSSKNIFPALRMLVFLKLKFKAEVLHVHDAEMGRLLKFFGISPMVLTVHNTGIDSYSMKYFDKIFAISNTVSEDILKRKNLKSQVIYNGIKSNLVKRKILISEKESYQLIHVKRLDHSLKGQDLLIEAINVLVNTKKNSNIHLTLVGEGNSRNYLQDTIHRYQLQDHVKLIGNKNREWVYENLSNYDLFVHPSRIEGFGLTVVEAMTAKVPVIASDIEGPAEILENGKYGLLFKSNDFIDLANSIKKAIHFYEKDEISPLVEAAYQHSLSNFDISITAKKYCESYY